MPIFAKDADIKPEELLAQIQAAEARIAVLEDLLAQVTRGTDPATGQDTLTFSGMNVQVVNGTGDTDSANGTGNLIVGYNDLRGDATDDRSGSHMIVVGVRNSYASYGGMVVGDTNSTAAPLSTVIGGRGNETLSVLDFEDVLTESMMVLGGENNLATGRRSVIIGGELSSTTGKAPDSVVVSGNSNAADFGNSFIGGGLQNTTMAYGASIHGGRENVIGDGTTATGQWASIHGGRNNTVMGFYGSISGGRNNEASGLYSSVHGGRYNTVNGNFSSISGGIGPVAADNFGENPDTHTP